MSFQNGFHGIWNLERCVWCLPLSLLAFIIYSSPEIISVSDIKICYYGNNYVMSRDQRIMNSWIA